MSMTTEATTEAEAVGLGRGGRMSWQRKRADAVSFLRVSLREPSPSRVLRWFLTALRSDPERHAPVPRREAEAMSFDPRPPLQELSHAPVLARPRRRTPTNDRAAR